LKTQTTGYYPDLAAFSLTKLKGLLKIVRLLPSQRILLENLDERFSCLTQAGIENLEQLKKVLKTTADIQSFAQATGLPVDYLTILRREANSYEPKPIDLQDLPGVNPGVVRTLRRLGIRTTEQLFPHVLTRKSRREFAKQHQIEEQDLLELTQLTDVARTKWVGPKFARLLIESGYDTVEKIAAADYRELHQALVRANEAGGIYQGKFGIEDMKTWVEVVAQTVPQVIQY
jgi:predicted flap endonuclease-1-like 5' DNA nuclease